MSNIKRDVDLFGREFSFVAAPSISGQQLFLLDNFVDQGTHEARRQAAIHAGAGGKELALKGAGRRKHE